jgi:hypothetical protein
MRWTASRTPLMPRPISVDRPSDNSRTATIPTDEMMMLRRNSGARRLTATVVGMPTLRSQGPRPMTAFP